MSEHVVDEEFYIGSTDEEYISKLTEDFNNSEDGFFSISLGDLDD